MAATGNTFSQLAVAVEYGGSGEGFAEVWRQHNRRNGMAKFARHARRFVASAGAELRENTYWLAKRLLDLMVASVTMLVLSPILIVVAALIKLADGGPVLYWQQRVGRWGGTFACPKFRSMYQGADRMLAQLRKQNDHGDGITFKMRNDPRVTWIGRIIRRLSIDETPQLWCVITGEMTLVGPRPALPSEVSRYRQIDRRRLDVPPGLTCIWQVSGRGNLPFAQQVVLDIQYIENRSLWLDLVLLARTVPAVLTGRGAY